MPSRSAPTCFSIGDPAGGTREDSFSAMSWRWSAMLWSGFFPSCARPTATRSSRRARSAARCCGSSPAALAMRGIGCPIWRLWPCGTVGFHGKWAQRVVRWSFYCPTVGAPCGVEKNASARLLVRQRSGCGEAARRGEIDEGDADPPGHVEDALVPVELAIDDPLDAGVGDHLEAGPAGAGGGVDVRGLDAHAVARRLEDGVGLGVDGGDAVAVLQHVPGVIAVRHPPDAPVVAGGEDDAVAHQQRAHVLAIAGGPRRHHPGDLHEVAVPVRAHGRGVYCSRASGAAVAGGPISGVTGRPASLPMPLRTRNERILLGGARKVSPGMGTSKEKSSLLMPPKATLAVR